MEHQVQIRLSFLGNPAAIAPIKGGDGLRALLAATADMFDRSCVAAMRRETTASVGGSTVHLRLDDIDQAPTS